ncbi:MAG TPA: ABC transporter ATP-binding protein [Anaerolineae bacterium]|nr:ABC transporter ATP-binding protein [Anaerolineae bacterium]
MDLHSGTYRRLLGYLGPYRKPAALAYASMMLATVLNLVIPQIIASAIDLGISTGEVSSLFTAAAIILGIGAVRAAAGYGQRYFGEWLTHRVAYDLRNDYYDHVQRQPFDFHDRTQTGDLMSRATSDISETERFVGIGLMDLLATILLLLGVAIAMILENARLALLALIPLPILVAATIRFGGRIRPRFKSIQEQMAVLSTTMQESLTGIRVVKAFAREPYELQKFDLENDKWFHRRHRVIRMWANNWPFFSFTLSISVFLLLWFGGPQALAGTITVGTLFVMISYVLMLNGPVQRLGFLVNLAATASASAGRVFEIIDQPPEVAEAPDGLALDHIEGAVDFEDVGFAYQADSPVLKGISFQVSPGQTIALMGPTGSGKSTITSLVARFYDPSHGSVRVEGIDTRDWQLAALRRHIGAVLQDSFLFSASVAENIAYGRPSASRDEIIVAAKAARAHGFISAFQDGYETQVGERGVTLSGGQKQRIAIARALLTDPSILILDDSTSSVDTETEHMIQQALNVLMEGRTTFVIAQRLLTLKNADLILVLQDGKIAQRGLHEELLAAGGPYKEIYDIQLKDQEEFARLQDRMESTEDGG